MTEKVIQEETIQDKAVSVLSAAQFIVQHSAALSYCKDIEEIRFHLFWIGWYFESLGKSFGSLNDVGF